MHKYFKEVKENRELIGICSCQYRDIKFLHDYKDKIKTYNVDNIVLTEAIEIPEKEYDLLRKSKFE